MPMVNNSHPIMIFRPCSPIGCKVNTNRNTFTTHNLNCGNTSFRTKSRRQVCYRRSSKNRARIWSGIKIRLTGLQCRVDIRRCYTGVILPQHTLMPNPNANQSKAACHNIYTAEDIHKTPRNQAIRPKVYSSINQMPAQYYGSNNQRKQFVYRNEC